MIVCTRLTMVLASLVCLRVQTYTRSSTPDARRTIYVDIHWDPQPSPNPRHATWHMFKSDAGDTDPSTEHGMLVN